MQRVVHLIIGLGDGGAERTLFKLVTGDFENEHIVLSLQGGGKYERPLLSRGIPVRSLQLNGWASVLPTLYSVVRELRLQRPSILHAWMPHAALIGSMAAIFVRIPTLIWGMRASDYGSGARGLTTRLIVWMLAALSWFCPKTVVVVGEKTLRTHRAYGFSPSKMVKVENGYSINTIDSAADEPLDQPFLRIVYTGTIFPGRRDPSALFEAISTINARNRTPPIKVEFYGRGLEYVQDIAERFGISSSLFIGGEVDHRESKELQRGADVLLIIFWNHPTERYSFSGKLFEYISARRPILAIGCRDAEGSKLIESEGLGEVRESSQEIAEFLQKCLAQKLAEGHIPSPEVEVERFSRKIQSLSLLREMRKIQTTAL